MSVPVIEALLADDRVGAGQLLGCYIPDDAPLHEMPLAIRLAQLQRDATLEPWLLQAMIERGSGTLVGHIGFHTAPRPEYLAGIAPDGVEFGYTVHEPFRRQGFATEAAVALMHWAYSVHGQRCFVLSISPDNLPSTNLAAALGFKPCGSHIDDADGLEIIHVRRFEQWPAEWRVEEPKTRLALGTSHG